MLPFTKRPAREEVISTGEIEVLRSNSRGARTARGHRAKTPSNHPREAGFGRATLPSCSDEEMTRLVPRANPTGDFGVWASSKPASVSSDAWEAPKAYNMRPTLPSSPRRSWTPTPLPEMERDDEETLVRAASISPFPSARAAQARARAPKRVSHPVIAAVAPDSIPPVAMPAPVPPPAAAAGTVITNRVRRDGRPTAVWAVALVTMGLFAGLASSLLARGDADSIIDATASFVDPARAGGSHAAAPAAAAQLAVAPAVSPAAATPVIGYVPSSSPLPPTHPATDAVAGTDLPLAADGAARDRPPPVAYAAPGKVIVGKPVAIAKPVIAHHSARPTTPAPAKLALASPADDSDAKDVKETKDVVKETKVAAFAPEPIAPIAAKPARATRGKHHASDDDLASASAADELARAQLEAALR